MKRGKCHLNDMLLTSNRRLSVHNLRQIMGQDIFENESEET